MGLESGRPDEKELVMSELFPLLFPRFADGGLGSLDVAGPHPRDSEVVSVGIRDVERTNFTLRRDDDWSGCEVLEERAFSSAFFLSVFLSLFPSFNFGNLFLNRYYFHVFRVSNYF